MPWQRIFVESFTLVHLLIAVAEVATVFAPTVIPIPISAVATISSCVVAVAAVVGAPADILAAAVVAGAVAALVAAADDEVDDDAAGFSESV